MSKNLGLLIKHYRLARNMTQQDLAKLSGVSSSTISKLESGNYIPTIRLLEKNFKNFKFANNLYKKII